jgi:Protein of unknown function (DUF2924)
MQRRKIIVAKTIKQLSPGIASHALLPSVSAIEQMDRDSLVALWQQMLGSATPRSISQPLLRRYLAWEVQVRMHGGLSARELEQIARLGEGNRRCKSPQMASGTRYLREWNGVTHVVEKVADGYLWNGGVHASLSAIAGAITGAHWSGPRFFGVTRNGQHSSPGPGKGSMP